MHEINRPNMNRIKFYLGLTGSATKRDVKKMYEYIIQFEENTKKEIVKNKNADKLLIKSLAVRIKELEEILQIDEKLLNARDKVLNLIPKCPVHGTNCLPHYEDWIKNNL